MKTDKSLHVTQKHIAEALHIDISTVSKALRGDPRIAGKTRAAVEAAAERMGYHRDPMLAALANHRRGLKGRPHRAGIAWVHNHARAVDMGVFAGYHEYFEGARLRAEKLGYAIERFYLEDKGLTAERLGGILQARNIQCAVVAPQAGVSGSLALPWERLCAITIGYTLREPALNLVTNDHFLTMTDLLRRMRERDYKRIGCYLSKAENERMGGRAGSAFLAYSKECRVKVSMFTGFHAADFLKWVDEHRFDGVIAPGKLAMEALREAGRPPPGSVALAGYALAADEREVSGMSHNNRRIGELTVDLLCRAFEHGEFGLPDQPVRLLVPPVWLDNGTL